VHPLLALGVVSGDLRVERFRNTVERDAVLCLDNELLFEPELLLEVLQLSDEGDYLAGDATDNLDLGEVLLNASGAIAIYIVQVHDLVLDVEVQLATQERA